MTPLAPPPRAVPLALRLRLLFGGGLGGFAWLWLTLTLPLAIGVMQRADITGAFVFGKDTKLVKGVATGCEATGAEEGASKRWKRPGVAVFGNGYTFVVDGRTYTGVSFKTGVCHEKGAEVTIEYLPRSPEVNRIIGHRRKVFGMAAGFAGFFPLIGVAMALAQLWKARRTLRLLRHGVLAQGELVRTEPTRWHAANKQIQRLTFAFTTASGQRMEIPVETSEPEKARDDAREPILYDPDRPERATAWDLLEEKEHVNARGELNDPGARSVLWVMLLPVLATVGTVAALILA